VGADHLNTEESGVGEHMNVVEGCGIGGNKKQGGQHWGPTQKLGERECRKGVLTGTGGRLFRALKEIRAGEL